MIYIVVVVPQKAGRSEAIYIYSPPLTRNLVRTNRANRVIIS
jgi:hypothetical protein